MPTETTRLTKMLRIFNPDDATQYVDVKIIDQISFIIDYEQYWEIEYHIHNDKGDTQRVVRNQLVVGSDGTSKVNVERILEYPHIVDYEQYWEKVFMMGGNKEEHEPKPQHYDTFEVQIFGKNSDGTPNTDIWVKMQRMRAFDAIVDYEQYWEKRWLLQWPTEDASDDMDNPDQQVDVSYDPSGGGDIPPYRMDPWQNLIDVSWGGGLAVVFYKKDQGP